MKNCNFFYCFLLFFPLLFSSCNKESVIPETQTLLESNIPVNREYDKSVSQIALAVHQSLNDNQFGNALKNAVMARPDGDYEVILKSFVNKNTVLNKTPLLTCLGANELNVKGDGSNVLEKYPKLQISIPVNAEKWDGKSKLWVLCLPSNYDEFVTKEVPAISPEGKETMFNIEKQPDFPVIVIGQNERSNINGDLKYEYNLLHEKVKSNILPLNSKSGYGFESFSATPVTNAMAVSLDWTFNYPEELQPYDHFFEIYRDDLTGGGFQKIGEADGWQSSYYDYNDVLPTRTYIYFLIARVDYDQTYNRDYYSNFDYSNTDEAAIPQIPTFTSYFSVECIAPSVMDIRWTINNLSNWTNLKIERYTGYNPIPELVSELPITTIHYFDYLSNPDPAYSVKYRYTLTVYNVNNNASQAIYCDEMLSNRIDYQALNVTAIQFNSWDDMRRYESWILGAPEIQLFVNKVINDTPHVITDNANIGGPAATVFGLNFNICTWDKSDAKVYTISLNEDDGGSIAPIEISLGSTAKVTLPMGIELSKTSNIKTTLNLRNNDDFIGTGYLYWWDNADGKDVQCGYYCKATIVSVPN